MYKIFSLNKRRFLWTAICVLSFVFAGTAQTESARIQGTVTDQAGASVPNATLTITNLDINREVTVQTNEDGGYSVLALQPGRYRIVVTQTDFKTVNQEVKLEVAQTATLNFALETGAVSETVTITSDTPLVESSSSSIGEVIQGRQIVELPLNGRNVLELARLVPGVTQGRCRRVCFRCGRRCGNLSWSATRAERHFPSTDSERRRTTFCSTALTTTNR